MKFVLLVTTVAVLIGKFKMFFYFVVNHDVFWNMMKRSLIKKKILIFLALSSGAAIDNVTEAVKLLGKKGKFKIELK